MKLVCLANIHGNAFVRIHVSGAFAYNKNTLIGLLVFSVIL